jgi:hypothetical protein
MKKNRKRNPGDRFVLLPHYMLGCPAFKTLPGDAVKLLLYIWKRHRGINNGEISYGVREAAEIGIPKSRTSRMFAVLTERGFLAVVRDAGFNVGDRKTRTWRLTAEPYRDAPGSKDFMRWKPASVPPAGLNGHNPSPAGRTERAASDPPKNLFPSPTSGTLSPTSGTKVIKLPATVPPAGLKSLKTAALSPTSGTLIYYQAEPRLNAPAVAHLDGLIRYDFEVDAEAAEGADPGDGR